MNRSITEQKTDLVHRVCALCGRDNKDEDILYRNLAWSLKACCQCGFVYIEDVPKYEGLVKSFSWRQSWQN